MNNHDIENETYNKNYFIEIDYDKIIVKTNYIKFYLLETDQYLPIIHDKPYASNYITNSDLTEVIHVTNGIFSAHELLPNITRDIAPNMAPNMVQNVVQNMIKNMTPKTTPDMSPCIVSSVASHMTSSLTFEKHARLNNLTEDCELIISQLQYEKIRHLLLYEYSVGALKYMLVRLEHMIIHKFGKICKLICDGHKYHPIYGEFYDFLNRKTDVPTLYNFTYRYNIYTMRHRVKNLYNSPVMHNISPNITLGELIKMSRLKKECKIYLYKTKHDVFKYLCDIIHYSDVELELISKEIYHMNRINYTKHITFNKITYPQNITQINIPKHVTQINVPNNATQIVNNHKKTNSLTLYSILPNNNKSSYITNHNDKI